MKIQLVLCWLAVVAIVGAGCVTDRNTAAKAKTAGEPHAIRKITLPKQKAEPVPFQVRVETSYSPRSERELVPAMLVSEYLEVIATRNQLPLQVREGLIVKQEGQWHLAEVPFERSRRHGCLPPFVHYAIWRERR